jgi:Fe2+ or Zn2+ uptake regulation protein
MPAVLDAMVLQVLRSSSHALSAYEIAQRIATREKDFAATQAYRSLARLVAMERAARLEGLNAYCHRDAPHLPIVYCRHCRRTAPTVPAAVSTDLAAQAIARAGAAGFRVRNATVEIAALCTDCETGATH